MGLSFRGYDAGAISSEEAMAAMSSAGRNAEVVPIIEALSRSTWDLIVLSRAGRYRPAEVLASIARIRAWVDEQERKHCRAGFRMQCEGIFLAPDRAATINAFLNLAVHRIEVALAALRELQAHPDVIEAARRLNSAVVNELSPVGNAEVTAAETAARLAGNHDWHALKAKQDAYSQALAVHVGEKVAASQPQITFAQAPKGSARVVDKPA